MSSIFVRSSGLPRRRPQTTQSFRPSGRKFKNFVASFKTNEVITYWPTAANICTGFHLPHSVDQAPGVRWRAQKDCQLVGYLAPLSSYPNFVSRTGLWSCQKKILDHAEPGVPSESKPVWRFSLAQLSLYADLWWILCWKRAVIHTPYSSIGNWQTDLRRWSWRKYVQRHR